MEKTNSSTNSPRNLYSALRQDANNKIAARRKYTGGTNFMRDQLVIKKRDSVIRDTGSVYDILCQLGNQIGFDTIINSGVKIPVGTYGYPLVKTNSNADCYTQYRNWYVLSNMTVTSVALTLNELFEQCNINLIATVEDRQRA